MSAYTFAAMVWDAIAQEAIRAGITGIQPTTLETLCGFRAPVRSSRRYKRKLAAAGVARAGSSDASSPASEVSSAFGDTDESSSLPDTEDSGDTDGTSCIRRRPNNARRQRKRRRMENAGEDLETPECEGEERKKKRRRIRKPGKDNFRGWNLVRSLTEDELDEMERLAQADALA